MPCGVILDLKDKALYVSYAGIFRKGCDALLTLWRTYIIDFYQ